MNETQMKITYRAATLQDIDGLTQLRWEFSPEEYRQAQSFADFQREFREFLGAALSNGSWLIWVAESDKRLISTAFLQKIRRTPRPSKMHRYWGNITNVYTLPELRGQGIGTAIMKEIMNAAKDDGIEALILWPADGVSDFYQRLGFSSDREVMELKLK